jgi:predicted RNase H-like HicB family nuclease
MKGAHETKRVLETEETAGLEPLEYYLGREYPVVLYAAEEGGYVAEIEELPGCITQGETRDEACEAIEEARRAWLEACYEDGMEIPAPRTEQQYSGRMLLRMPRSLHRRLSEQARREGVSVNQYVVTLLAGEVRTPKARESVGTTGRVSTMDLLLDLNIGGRVVDKRASVNWPQADRLKDWFARTIPCEGEAPVAV